MKMRRNLPMNTIVIYFSRFGHTKLVAETIAETMQANGSVRVIGADQLTNADLEGAELVVMGTPTHKMNLPEAVRPVFDSLPKRILKDVPVAAFDTSYKMGWFLNKFTAAKKLNRKMRKMGGKPILPPETFLVVDREGPLYDGEIERAEIWAESILDGYNRFSEHR
ncbi:MAG: flavodoxin family protein [Chloroflexota bacterium]|nr:flavodoxin family protein [Chloroflexota bacterium]